MTSKTKKATRKPKPNLRIFNATCKFQFAAIDNQVEWHKGVIKAQIERISGVNVIVHLK